MLTEVLYHLTLTKFLIILGITIFFDLLILNVIGRKRKNEIEEIKSVIKKIRKNQITSEEEIQLSPSLSDLEGNIKSMHKKTIRDLERMEKLAQARTDFLGYVSHELRTPIFTIQGYLETLQNGAIDDPKVNRNFLNKAKYHSENLNTLLNDLIDISMIESGLMSLSFRYFNLSNFLNDIVKNIQVENLNEKIELSLSDFDNEIDVYGDKEKLRQVMNNLINNAIKYTEEGSVTVSVLEKNKTIIVSVKDTGIGIDESDYEKIFQRFYRTPRDRSSNIPGTGLGLAIVKHIIEAHNSTVEVNSEIGKGTEFSFKLKKFQ